MANSMPYRAINSDIVVAHQPRQVGKKGNHKGLPLHGGLQKNVFGRHDMALQ
jgi:hypothetical protein